MIFVLKPKFAGIQIILLNNNIKINNKTLWRGMHSFFYLRQKKKKINIRK
jgi:hypothetical protein